MFSKSEHYLTALKNIRPVEWLAKNVQLVNKNKQVQCRR